MLSSEDMDQIASTCKLLLKMRSMLLVIVFTLLTASTCRKYDESVYVRQFYDYLKNYNVTIKDGDDYYYRLQIFAETYDFIEEYNAQNTGTVLGINKFSHMTTDEFKTYVNRGGFRPDIIQDGELTSGSDIDFANLDLPPTVDWTLKGAVTGVKDQGVCGSCWSFSATGALEGAYYLKYGSLKSFSEQYLVSCDTECHGCNGCDINSAFRYIKAHKGLPTESNYPYTSGDSGTSGTCQKDHKLISNATPKSYKDVTRNSVNALMVAVSKQPISIAVQADQNIFQNYESGIIRTGCGQNINHAVLLVGYGTLNGIDYWKVKNSWGTDWGNDGYVLIERSNNNVCGVLKFPCYPVL